MAFGLLIVACAYHPDTEEGDDDDRPWEGLSADADTDADSDADADADTDPDTDTDTDADTDADIGTDPRWHAGERLVYVVSEEEGDGYLTVSLTNVTGGYASFTLYVDGEWAWGESADLEDRDLGGWVSVTAGHEYLFEIGGGDDLALDFTVEHHAVDDRYEPNDVSDDAAAIGGRVFAYFHAAESAGSSFEDGLDWYSFESDGRPFTVTLSDVPAEIRSMVEVWDASDMEWTLDWESAWNEGDDVELVVDPDHAGTYLVAVEGYGVETHDVGAVPAYLSSPYTLTVENR